jgi:transketolase
MVELVKDLNAEKVKFFVEIARDIRRTSVEMVYRAGSGSPGSTLSVVDILVWLYFHEMIINPQNCRDENRDRLILSKGQAAPGYYAIFEKFGWVNPEELMSFRGINTRLATHPEYNTLPAVDFTSGSLGMGLSAANGMAIAARLTGKNDIRFFIIMGDGETQEGQVWEAAMTAGHYKLSNVINIIDRNIYQGDQSCLEVMTIEPITDKWTSFGWDVIQVDGHDFNDMHTSFAKMKSDKPKLIIANTVKGKGVSFMEDNNAWHTGGPKFTEELFKIAMKDLEVDHE